MEKLRKNKDERTTMMLDTMIESRMDHNSMKVTNIKEIETHMNFFIIGGMLILIMIKLFIPKNFHRT